MIDGNKIRLFREQADLTQAQLASRVDVSQSMIGYMERGFKRPTIELLAHIADCLGVKVDDLLKKDES